jgi:regulator of sigma E protease
MSGHVKRPVSSSTINMIEHLLSWIQDTGVFLVVLSILIVVHEWGHFITAKKLGVKVEEFALGFGQTLWSKVHNGTNYMLKLLPLGGYVKMAGDERSKCQGQPDEFYSKSVGHRALVVVNGPVVNFALAYVSLIFVFLLGYPGLSTKIMSLDANGPAQVAGLQLGDKIIGFNQKKIYGWNHFESLLEGNKTDPLKITVLRNGEEVSALIQPKIMQREDMLGQMSTFRDLGIQAAYTTNIIGEVIPGEPAEQAGLQKEDRIIQIDSKSVSNWKEINEYITTSSGEKINIKISRNGQELTKDITPKVHKFKNKKGLIEEKKRIGIAPLTEMDHYRFGLGQSLINAWEKLWEVTVMTYKSVYYMITGSLSAKDSVGGPILIFNVVKSAAQQGLSDLLLVVGVVSASLAIFNLFPVIPLDGGHLMLLAIEKVRRRPLPEKIEEYVAKIGFTLIIMLAIYIFYIDFERVGVISGIEKMFSHFLNQK